MLAIRPCTACGRDNCRVDLWRRRVELMKAGEPPDVPLDMESAERGFYAAKVSCFIRAGQRAPLASPR